LAVGASTSSDTIAGWTRPTTASFSSAGTRSRHVDLLAPGTSIASLRDPGSFVDVNHPEGLVSGDTTGRLFRGSGTSQAAAVASGVAALLLQAYPNLTPDQVKALLVATAAPVPDSVLNAGAGEINAVAALAAAKASGSGSTWKGTPGNLPAAATQTYPISTGQGSIQAARGDNILVDAAGDPLAGEVDVQGNPWHAAAWWAATSTGRSWVGGMWMGATWTGDGWVGSTDGMLSARWASAQWDSARWADADWSDASWDSARWASARWASARWASARWADLGW
jgi:serine protease AprX